MDALQARFSKLHFTLAKKQPVPEGWVFRNGTKVNVGEVLDDGERKQGMTIALFDRDLAPPSGTFVYGGSNPQKMRGAVSVSRFRTEKGAPTEPGEIPTGDDLLRSKARFQAQITSTIGKMLGMSAPCQASKCVLRFPSRMSEFDEKGGDFCEAHKAELERLLP